MKKRLIFYIILLFIFSCTHKEVKNNIEKDEVEIVDVEILDIEEKKIVEEDTTDDIEFLYNRLVDAIIKKKLDEIGKCYYEYAIFQYSDNVEKNINCFDGSKKIIGIENIKKNYDYLFKKRYLNRIEYEIVKIYRETNPKKIIFINLWLNVEFDFYEIMECILIDKKYYISNHTIVKGKEIRDSIY